MQKMAGSSVRCGFLPIMLIWFLAAFQLASNVIWAKDAPIPPEPPVKWNHTAEDILRVSHEAITLSNKTMDEIAGLDKGNCTFHSLIPLYIRVDEAWLPTNIVAFYHHVSPSEDVRAASKKAVAILQQYHSGASARIDLYQVLMAAKQNTNTSSLDPESRRLLRHRVRLGSELGLDLPESSRQQLKQLRYELDMLASKFTYNLNEGNEKIWFSSEELRGVPQDVLRGYEQGQDGKLAMTVKNSDYDPVMQYAILSETRRRAFEAFNSRATANAQVLERIISIRRQCAHILGRENWAAFSLETKMAKNVTAVNNFLGDLRKQLTPLGQKERALLLQLKKMEYGEYGFSGNSSKLYIWDTPYYSRLYLNRTLSFDTALVQEYFPATHVINAIFEIYQSLLSLKFFKVENPDVWHPSVTLWAVWDADVVNNGSAKDGRGFLGYLYLDLEPRPSKYTHAACWGLIPPSEKADGSRRSGVAVLVANLAKTRSDLPPLLTHSQVTTLFHEMGHAFHHLLGKSRFIDFASLEGVPRDFVEAPSQMLENWTWDESQLLKMSQHYERPTEKLPKGLMQKIVASRHIMTALSDLRQIFLGMFDMYLHTSAQPGVDLNHLWNRMRDEIGLMDPSLKEVPGFCSFGHIASGYDAGYYGYMYSQVFSADMFETVFAANLMSPVSGRSYRREILEPAATREAMDSLTAFLGRPPNRDAFIRQLLSVQNGKIKAD